MDNRGTPREREAYRGRTTITLSFNRGTPRNGRGEVRRVGTILLIAVAAALAWVAFSLWWLWLNQERVVFQPPVIVAPTPDQARRVEFLSADGHPLHGFMVEPRAENGTPRTERREPKTVVIAFHGNADLAAFLVPWAGELAQRAGVTVFIPEYRGYGGIPGRPTYETVAADALVALAYAREHFVSADIVLFGHSLGSALATDLAAAMAPDVPRSLVLQSPFTSAQDMAARMLVPPVPSLWRRISRVHYDTRAIVARLGAPVWVSHGSRDVVVPARMGRAVFDAARQRGELLIVEGAGHNDVPDVGGQRYWAWLTRAVSPRLVELEEEGGRRLP